jgi:hypothetical protein
MAYPVAIDFGESTEAQREWPGQTMLKATLICVRRKRFSGRVRGVQAITVSQRKTPERRDQAAKWRMSDQRAEK